MDVLHALILSVIEGITEFLPISSTGHLVLASKLLSIPQTEFVKTFEIAIQGGAILSVIVLYAKRLLTDAATLKKVIVAFVPTGIVGLTLYKFIKTILIGSIELTIAMLLLGGIVIILLEIYFKKNKPKLEIKDLSYKKAFLVGVFQSISIVPGVSRAAATIFGGMGMGLNRKAAVEFSFMLAIPTLLAATGLDLVKSVSGYSPSEFQILSLGFLGAFITALIVIKWLLTYVQRFSFVPFGVYRIILASVFFIFLR